MTSDNRSSDLSCIHRAGCPKPNVCREVGHCTSMTETDMQWWDHDPDLDENGVCRICGKHEPE